MGPHLLKSTLFFFHWKVVDLKSSKQDSIYGSTDYSIRLFNSLIDGVHHLIFNAHQRSSNVIIHIFNILHVFFIPKPETLIFNKISPGTPATDSSRVHPDKLNSNKSDLNLNKFCGSIFILCFVQSLDQENGSYLTLAGPGGYWWKPVGARKKAAIQRGCRWTTLCYAISRGARSSHSRVLHRSDGVFPSFYRKSGFLLIPLA